MFTVKIEGIDELKRNLSDMAGKQVPFATARAITQTAKSVETKLQNDMAATFKTASPYAKRSTFTSPANKYTLAATVGLKDQKPSGGTAPSTLLKEHFTAGLRGNKPYEKALISMGVMPKGYRAIPARGLKLNSYGNPSQSDIRRILDVIRSGDIYDGNVNTGTSKFRQKNSADISYFLKKVGDNNWRSRHLVPGIYRRVYEGRRRKKAAIPVLIFVKSANYKKLFDLERIADEVSAREFQTNFDAAFAESMRTAL